MSLNTKLFVINHIARLLKSKIFIIKKLGKITINKIAKGQLKIISN